MVVISADDSATGGVYTGVSNAIDDSTDGIAAVGAGFGQFNSDTSAILRRASASVVDYASGVAGFDLSWGVWEATPETPATAYTSVNSPESATDLTSSIILVNANPTDVSQFTGKKKFTGISDYLLRARGFDDNSIGSVAGEFTVDLETAAFSDGKLNICVGASACDIDSLGTHFWPIRFEGNLLQQGTLGSTELDPDLVSAAQINTQGIGMFVGAEAEGFVLSFVSSGSGADTSGKSVNGSVLYGDPIDAGSVLSAADLATLDGLGFVAFNTNAMQSPATDASEGFYFGGAADPVSDKPIFTNSPSTRVGETLPLSFGVVLQDGASVSTLVDNVGGYDLVWGTWNAVDGDANQYVDSNSTLSEDIVGETLFAAGVPAPIQANTNAASATFAVSQFLLGGQSDNASNVARGSFTIDADSGVLRDFRVQLCIGSADCDSATQIWTSDKISQINISSDGHYIDGTVFQGKVFAPLQKLNTTFEGYVQGLFVNSVSSNEDIGFAAGFRWLENGSKLSGNQEIIDAALLFTLSSDPISELGNTQLAGVNRTGIIWGGDVNQKIGSTSDFSGSSQLFVSAGSDVTFPITENDDFSYLQLSERTPEHLQSNVGGFDLHWGVWKSDSSDPFELRNFYGGVGDNLVEKITGLIFGMSLKETPFGTFTGQRSFSTITDKLILAEGFDNNDIGSVTGSLTVDLESAEVFDGKLEICVGADTCTSSSYGTNYWPIFFSGAFVGAGVQSNSFSSAVFPDKTVVIRSTATGFIMGDQAEGFVLSFSSSSGSGADTTEAFGNASNASGRPISFVNGAVLFGESTSASSLSNNTGSNPIRDDTSNPVTEYYNIDWGAWNNPVDQNHITVENSNGSTTISSDDYQAVLTPTPVANLQGTAAYSTHANSGFIGNGSAGSVTDLSAEMSVDFNTGAISGGKLKVEVGSNDVWSLDFNGSVAQGSVQMNMTSGQLSQLGTVVSESITADLGGVFTGTNAEVFVGGFDLLDQVNELNHVNGLYTLEQ